MGKDIVKVESGQVSFTQHSSEFIRFFSKQRNICDEISGNRKIYLDNKENQVEITYSNFIIAIKKTYAFIIDYIHYVADELEKREILGTMEKIELDFINDDGYHKTKDRYSLLSTDRKIEFEITYFKYMFRCFEIIDKFSQLLQSSLMVSTSEIRKKIYFMDSRSFYDRLSEYRESISTDISNFKLSNIINHFKKILAYHYTYRLFVSSKEIFVIDDLVTYMFSLLMNEEVRSLIIKSSEGMVTEIKKKEIYAVSIHLKKMIFIIYRLTNKSLSNRNILPKILPTTLLDKTLI